jgi:DICT domain-containing protein
MDGRLVGDARRASTCVEQHDLLMLLHPGSGQPRYGVEHCVPNLQKMLTIGELSARTGVRSATLREWERRHGFPWPERLPSGHRRYPAAVVEEVRAVLERQRAGLSLSAAIRSVRAATSSESSIYAAVAETSARPSALLSRRAMLAISRSIEDACAAAGSSAAIVGSFQREAVFRGCEARWAELARTASACVVLADFNRVSVGRHLVEVPIGDQSPLRREWAIAVVGPRLAACVAGWESLEPGSRRFEAHWSVEPGVVRAGVERGLTLGRVAAPGAVADVAMPAPGDDPLREAMALFDRVLGRLDRG